MYDCLVLLIQQTTHKRMLHRTSSCDILKPTTCPVLVSLGACSPPQPTRRRAAPQGGPSCLIRLTTVPPLASCSPPHPNQAAYTPMPPQSVANPWDYSLPAPFDAQYRERLLQVPCEEMDRHLSSRTPTTSNQVCTAYTAVYCIHSSLYGGMHTDSAPLYGSMYAVL